MGGACGRAILLLGGPATNRPAPVAFNALPGRCSPDCWGAQAARCGGCCCIASGVGNLAAATAFPGIAAVSLTPPSSLSSPLLSIVGQDSLLLS